MKIIQITLALVCIAFYTQAQSMRNPVTFETSFGMGLLPTFLKDHGKTIVPPMTANVSYRIAPQFSLGLFGAYSVSDNRREMAKDGNMTQLRNNYFNTGLRLAIHTKHIQKWEAYGGIALGIQHSHIEVLEGDVKYLELHKKYKPYTTRMSYTGFVGGRYRLSPAMGVFGEIGLGASLITTGIQWRWHKGGFIGMAKK